MSKLSLISAVVCDEVRLEASGDAIIVGAKQTGPEISTEVRQAARGPIAFYIELESSYPPPASIRVRLKKMPEEDVVFEHDFSIGNGEPVEIPEDANATGVLLMVVNQKESPVRDPGSYRLECCGSDDDWIKLRDIFFPASEPMKE